MTAFRTENKLAAAFAVVLLLVQATVAQRPPFAGSRPPNGLSQKDKYNTNTFAGNTDIQNRFGETDAPPSVQIPFGQTQKPPVGLVVTPESSYVALQTTTNSVEFADRFGDPNNNIAPQNSSVVVPPVSASVYPLDAHGDRQLIEQLSRLPVDKRPFWFLNYQAIEAQRNGTVPSGAGIQAARGSFSG